MHHASLHRLCPRTDYQATPRGGCRVRLRRPVGTEVRSASWPLFRRSAVFKSAASLGDKKRTSMRKSRSCSALDNDYGKCNQAYHTKQSKIQNIKAHSRMQVEGRNRKFNESMLAKSRASRVKAGRMNAGKNRKVLGWSEDFALQRCKRGNKGLALSLFGWAGHWLVQRPNGRS